MVWDGGGPTILLLHGDMRTSRSFDALARELKGEFRIVALDARGHGGSDWPPTGYSIRDRVDDLTAFCKAIGLKDAVGIGHSMGGGIVPLSSQDAPGIFSSMVLLEPDFVFDDAFHRRGVRRFNRPRRAWASRSELQAYLGQHRMAGRWRDDVIEDVVQHETMEMPDGTVEMKWSTSTFNVEDGPGNRYDLRPVFRDMNIPGLFVLGEENAGYYADLARIASDRPGLRSVTVSGAGHNMYMERPDAVAALIKSFVAGEDLPETM
ncbi:MAG: alpha/beta hydrolase [Chloroflexi bacterium]|nr:alpha/beta hydrolase [Chloroflexota bacterium]